MHEELCCRRCLSGSGGGGVWMMNLGTLFTVPSKRKVKHSQKQDGRLHPGCPGHWEMSLVISGLFSSAIICGTS